MVRLSQLERWHFWFVGRRSLVERLLKKERGSDRETILDLGCGTGLLIEILTRQGHRVIGVDQRPEGLEATRRLLPRALLIRAHATDIPLTEDCCDIVLLLDVLEHVDDRAALTEVRRVLRPGGIAVITTPALPWLWSYRDEAAGHLRRYTRKELCRVAGDAKLEVAETRYYQFFLLPLVVCARLFGRKGPRLRDLEECPLPALNRILAWINRIEGRLGDVVRWPCGSSLVAVCRKI